MSPMTSRAVSMALLGGLAAALFPAAGLLDWAGFVAWAAFLAAGGDTTALKKTIPGFILGAILAWAAMALRHQVDVAPGSWLWMPRAGIAATAGLLILGLSTKTELLSHIPAGLTGFAVVFGAASIPVLTLRGMDRQTGLDLYNPLIQATLSMVAGAAIGWMSVKLAGALSKE